MDFDEGWYRDRLTRALQIESAARSRLRMQCADVTDVAEAWERVAPLQWQERSWSFVHGESVEPLPATVAQVCALCASPEKVVASEQLAFELASRLTDFGQRAPGVVQWHFWAVDLWAMGVLPQGRWARRGAPMLLAKASLEEQLRGRSLPTEVIDAIGRFATSAALVSLAMDCAHWSMVRPTEPNPFEVLIELQANGSTLLDLTHDRVALVVPV